MDRGYRDENVLVLQGGGALGSYQAGVFEALANEGIAPTWVAGISIGAINAALIAGNAPGERVARLGSSGNPALGHPGAGVEAGDGRLHGWLNSRRRRRRSTWHARASSAARRPAPLQRRGTLAAISYYDTAPLKETLKRLVDFERHQPARDALSVAAVNVRTGNSRISTPPAAIDVRHIMASGALPPGFPPVADRWRALLGRRPRLQHAAPLRARPLRAAAGSSCSRWTLFPRAAPLPKTLSEVLEREKDIRYSSRTRMNTDMASGDRATWRGADATSSQKLPPELRDDPDARQGCALRCEHERPRHRAAHLPRQALRESCPRTTSSRAHDAGAWAAGHADIVQSLRDPRWTERGPRALRRARLRPGQRPEAHRRDDRNNRRFHRSSRS